MRKQKNKRKNRKFIKPLMAAKFGEDAHRLIEGRSEREGRFLDRALIAGKDLEPCGRLAG